MLWQHLKLTFRLLSRHPLESVLTIAGLTVGLTGFLLSLAFVDYWWRCDGFHTNADRIYAVWQDHRMGDSDQRSTVLGSRVEEALRQDVPGVEQVVSMRTHSVKVIGATEHVSALLLVADPDILDTFTFPLAQGDASQVLADPRSVVLTHQAARTYFGDADPIGRTLELEFTGAQMTSMARARTASNEELAEARWATERLLFTVTGVLAPVPGATAIRFTMLASSLGNERLRDPSTSVTYLLLAPSVPPENVAAALTPKAIESGFREATVHLMPLRQVQWASRIMGLPSHGDELRTVGYGLLALSGLILFIACANYVGLAVARGTIRAAEVGIRQTVGAGRGQIGRQFLTEALVVASLAMVLGLALAEMLVPYIRVLDRQLVSFEPLTPRVLLLATALAGVVGILAGAYPALVVSRFAPVRSLASRQRLGGRSALSRSLIVAQFIVSTFLATIALVVPAQVQHLRHRSLGYNANELLLGYHFKRGRLDTAGVEALRQQLSPGGPVLSVAAASPGPSYSGQGVSWQHGPAPVPVACYQVSPGFLETVGLDLLAGRDFDPSIATDATEAIIVNQSMARMIGSEPLGAVLDGIRRNGPVQVIGIVADFDQGSVNAGIRPCFLHLGNSEAGDFGPYRDLSFWHLLARIAPGERAQGREEFLRVCEVVFPGSAPEVGFMDELLAARLETEGYLGRGLMLAATCALGVATLGLLSLVILAVGQRTREVGIRKALGATPQSLVLLLSSDLARLVLLGNLLAWPAAYWAASQWLQGYVYQVPLGPGLFLTASAAVLGVAMLVVAGHTLRAALANPVEALRYE